MLLALFLNLNLSWWGNVKSADRFLRDSVVLKRLYFWFIFGIDIIYSSKSLSWFSFSLHWEKLLEIILFGFLRIKSESKCFSRHLDLLNDDIVLLSCYSLSYLFAFWILFSILLYVLKWFFHYEIVPIFGFASLSIRDILTLSLYILYYSYLVVLPVRLKLTLFGTEALACLCILSKMPSVWLI